ncbi:MAG: exo-alpha-sialidase [Clostridia bacterium]|nr:exo-alpha-sialidase [Clostridia bacterium]
MKLKEKKMFTESDEKGSPLSLAFYTNNQNRIMKYTTKTKRSDTFADSLIQLSDDNLKSFYMTRNDLTSWQTEEGTMTKYFKVQIIDKKRNHLYLFYNQGLLPSNDPREGIKSWQMYYSLSKDGGETTEFYEPIIMEGSEYDINHPIDGVFHQKNSFMVGDYPCVPLILEDGKTILLALQIAVLDEEGNIFNPYGSFTYQSSHVLKGEIMDNGRIKWFHLSERMLATTDQSTRGTLEPCICKMDGNTVLMVNRGSNDQREELESYRWYCISEDNGDSFKGPYPWTYENGEKFYSPSSCSMLLRHSNNKVYWIGNICDENARGNMPRNPLCIVEVNQKSLLLIKSTKFDVIIRKKDDYHDITFSNFYAREEKETGDILIYCTSFWNNPEKPMESEGSYEYRVQVK